MKSSLMSGAATEQPAPTATTDRLAAMLHEYAEATDRLQQTHTTLQREVALLRAELASKDRELEARRRLAALGELAAGVAHEVRNPLAAIQLYSGLLRTECRAHQLGPAVHLIEKIEAGIHAIEAVVQDTLALAPRDRQFAVCGVWECVTRAADSARPVLLEHGVALHLRCDAERAAVRAEQNGLQRVLVNLIVNAAEASQPGRSVQVVVGHDGADEVVLRVLDEGCGLPEEIQHRLFDPFFTTKPNGTGLGLTIAHRLTEAFGGRLHARNRPEGGAEFTVSLPCASADSSTLESPATRPRQFNAA